MIFLDQLRACLVWLLLGSDWNRRRRRAAGFLTPLTHPKENR